uniref:NXPE C-terminal domain-containing protein n=2 Tax=Xenopus tropicalis TaxID=8364 RepID=F6ZCQ1_XENTR
MLSVTKRNLLIGLMFFVWILCVFFHRFLLLKNKGRQYSTNSTHSSMHKLQQTTANTGDTEFQNIMELIKWPSPVGFPHFENSTSAKTSEYHVKSPHTSYHVGEYIEVQIRARDHHGYPKEYGGDFFQVKLHSPEMKAGVVGSVIDHSNGSYTAVFLLAWPGNTHISVRLIYSSEAISILQAKQASRLDKVYFHGYFERNGTREIVECNLELLQSDVCEFIDLNSGEKWVCVRPKILPCDSWVYHSTGGERKVTTKEEDVFLKRSVINQTVPVSVTPFNVLSAKTIKAPKKPLPACTVKQMAAHPSGFYYNDTWISLQCLNRQFKLPSDARACLQDKNILMFGDSTLRQWFEYLEDFIPTLKRMDLHKPYNPGPLLAVDVESNIVMSWRCHGLPFKTLKMKAADLHYVVNEISGIGGGPFTVVVLSGWAHFTTYPVAVYVSWLRKLREAVRMLLLRSPETKVLIKSANTAENTVYSNNWFAFQFDKILRLMFSTLPVIVVDAWEMTSCHYLPEVLHPEKPVIKNEVNMMLSYICPH